MRHERQTIMNLGRADGVTLQQKRGRDYDISSTLLAFCLPCGHHPILITVVSWYGF